MVRRDETLSLVIPVYNSARFIAQNLEKAHDFIGRYPEGSEILVIDDGSTDDTAAVVERTCSRLGGPIRLIRNPINRGKSLVVRRAMGEARGAYRVFTDADLTYPIENVDHVVAALEEGADVAVACRVHPDSRYVVPARFLPMLITRHVMGRTFSLLARLALVGHLRDTQAGLKGFRAEASRRIFSKATMNRFSFDLEVLFIARRLGLKIAEVGVEFHYCKEPSTVRFVADSYKMLRDMARIRIRAARGFYDENGAPR